MRWRLLLLAVPIFGSQLVLQPPPYAIEPSAHPPPPDALLPNDVLQREWTVLGPLPAGMRELPFGGNPALAYGNPAFLLTLDRNRSVPSVYSAGANGGIEPIGVSATEEAELCRDSTPNSSSPSSASQLLTVRFPDYDWDSLRSTAGWSALQWQALAAADLRISSTGGTFAFAMDKVAEFALVPRKMWDDAAERADAEPRIEWYRGDWYSYNFDDQPIPDPSAPRSDPADGHAEEGKQQKQQQYHFPHLLHIEPGEYKLVLRLMYENRIFGDPRSSSDADGVPTVRVNLHIGKFQPLPVNVRVLDTPPSLVLPDVTGGWLAGYGVSVALQNTGSAEVTIQNVKVRGALHSYLEVTLHHSSPLHINALQTRPVIIVFTQQHVPIPSHLDSLELALDICDERASKHCRWVNVKIALTHKPEVMSDPEADSVLSSFVFTYMTPGGALDYAAAIPPRQTSAETEGNAVCTFPTVIGLHGAGVNAANPAWIAAFPRPNISSWTILPSGSSGWGYDWQLRSFDGARSAVVQMMEHLYGFPPDMSRKAKARIRSDPRKLFVVGHSNGGQGATYMIARQPDDVVAGIIAAGYVKVS